MADRSREAGFTLIEILVVILIIGMLAAYFGQNIFGQTDDAKISISRTVLTDSVPATLSAFYQSDGEPQPGANITQALISRGLPDHTPWGEAWSARVYNGYVAVDWPVPDISIAQSISDQYQSSELNASDMILGAYASPSSGSHGKNLEFRYQLPDVAGGL